MSNNNRNFWIHSSTILIYLSIITTAIEEIIEETTTKNLQNHPSKSITFNRIAGCPDLESFQQPFETLENSDKIGKITCLCGPSRGDLINENNEDNNEEDDEKASITCIYGSKLADLENTINLAKMSNKTIEKIILNHVDFESEKELLKILLEEQQTTSNLKYLEAKKCRNQLKFNEKIENNEEKELQKFNALEWIIIEECLLEKMPLNLLKRAPILKGLSLSGNKIHSINVADLAASKMSLESLNLAGNLLSSQIEAGSLSQLEMLKNLEIGEHNFASTQLLIEIGKLEKLEGLDMSQMDGIEKIDIFLNFEKMPNLKRLLLSGCNLRVLNSSSFVQFPALEMVN